MTEERALVLAAVLEGQIGVEHVTLEEIFEAEDVLFEDFASEVTPFTTWETIQ
jgi:hypothetical protein